jgi:hypothetical protein
MRAADNVLKHAAFATLGFVSMLHATAVGFFVWVTSGL